jgi:hypothetical protein
VTLHKQIHIDDAIRFMLDFARNPRKDGYGTYGYEIYIPNVIRAYCKEVDKDTSHNPGQGARGRELSTVFYDAGWELCRRGILRPGVIHMDAQATDSGGYCLTAAGRRWLEQMDDSMFIPTEPGRFANIIERFRPSLGEGFFQRSQEAVKCHFAGAYLACCAMCGAAAESIMLHVAIAKVGDEEKVLAEYMAARGRSKIENIIIGRLREPLAGNFRNLVDLIKYWRDEASHGTLSDISEFEAYEALARLLRLAHFVDDHWTELTTVQVQGKKIESK